MPLTVDPIRAKRKDLRTGFVCVAVKDDGQETLADVGCLDTESLISWLAEEPERPQSVVLVLLKHWTISTEVG